MGDDDLILHRWFSAGLVLGILLGLLLGTALARRAVEAQAITRLASAGEEG